MPRIPKPSHLRQRRNKTSTAATLPSEAESARNRVPNLPKREGGWHPMVKDWWRSVWKSPMASEYLASDVRGGLYQLACLHQIFWQTNDLGLAGSAKLPGLAAEIRLQEVRFGLSPIDRRRLQWEVERGEQATERTQSRKAKKAEPPKAPAADPREVLRAV